MNELKLLSNKDALEAKKPYEAPELVELGNVSELTNIDVSVP